MNTFTINKNNIEEIFSMCCVYAGEHKEELERLKQQNETLNKISYRFWRVKCDSWSVNRQNIAHNIDMQLNGWIDSNKERYNSIADAFHLAMNVVSLYCKAPSEFEEMHVNAVDMERIIAYNHSIS